MGGSSRPIRASTRHVFFGPGRAIAMVFTDFDLEQFISEGYVVLRRAFSRELAAECREFVWKQVPLWDQCTTFGQSMVQIQKGFACAPFNRIMNERLSSGLDQIGGVDRWSFY